MVGQGWSCEVLPTDGEGVGLATVVIVCVCVPWGRDDLLGGGPLGVGGARPGDNNEGAVHEHRCAVTVYLMRARVRGVGLTEAMRGAGVEAGAVLCKILSYKKLKPLSRDFHSWSSLRRCPARRQAKRRVGLASPLRF